MNRRKAVTEALRKPTEASPLQIWKVVREEEPDVTSEDIGFELYHGSRDPRKKVYEKIGRGRYRLSQN